MGKYDESIERMLNIEARAIYDLIDSLDRTTVEKVIDLLLTVKPDGRKVITAGCGTIFWGRCACCIRCFGFCSARRLFLCTEGAGVC